MKTGDDHHPDHHPTAFLVFTVEPGETHAFFLIIHTRL